MVSLLISLSRTADSLNTIPAHVISSLAADRPHWRDLKTRLIKLPRIKFGEYVGTMPAQTPHENAVKYATKHTDVDLFVGYHITRPDMGAPWQLSEHSFCVKDNKVVEPTEIDDYRRHQSFYCGFKVPSVDVSRLRYLNMFDRMSYLLEYSPMANR